MDLSIAGLPVCIESADTAFFNKRFADYRRDDDRAPVMRMRTVVLDHIPTPQGELIRQVDRVSIVRLADGRMCRYGRSDGGVVYFAVFATPDYSDVELQLVSGRRHPQFTQTDLEYVYTGSLFCDRLYALGGGVLHSSSLSYRGNGLAFSADSGTGKSTHVGLWKQFFPDDVEIINDDKPAIMFDGDQPLLCGTPWSGKTALNLNRQVPLRAIVFIERGTVNSIRRLDAMDSMYRLLGQISRPYYDAALGERAVDFAQRLYESLPIYCLTCDISREAVDTVYNTIFLQEAE